ncbi:MAG: hypothetical protein O3B09_03515, partial [Proteobacteria bacterium]|nr:hypothetical protein [Pseudomonadota bacterium]
MKQKTFSILLALTLTFSYISNAQAISFSKKLEEAVKDVGNGGTSSITSSVDGIEKKILKKVDDKINSVTSKIDGEIKQYKEKI